MEAAHFQRLLMAVASGWHEQFVPLGIGLATLVAVFDLMAWRFRLAEAFEAAHFWTRILLINVVCGVVTRWPVPVAMPAQWTAHNHALLDLFSLVFGFQSRMLLPMLLLVVVVAGRGRLPLAWRWLASAALALVLAMQSGAAQAVAAWMAHPVGTTLVGGVLRLTDPWALLWQRDILAALAQGIASAWLVGGVFAMGVSAWSLLRGRRSAMARLSLFVAVQLAWVALVLVLVLVACLSGPVGLLGELGPAWLLAASAIGLLLVLLLRLSIGLPDARTRRGRRVLWLCVAALPLPWIAGEAGWLLGSLHAEPWLFFALSSEAHGISRNAGLDGPALSGWLGLHAALLLANAWLTQRWIDAVAPRGGARMWRSVTA